jgi:hypothetical protein
MQSLDNLLKTIDEDAEFWRHIILFGAAIYMLMYEPYPNKSLFVECMLWFFIGADFAFLIAIEEGYNFVPGHKDHISNV